MWIVLAAARRSRAAAMTVIPADVPLPDAGLAVTFAGHLHAIRCRRGLYGACVTSPVAPPLPGPHLCRVPHPVTVEGPERTWRDTVVWEAMTTDRFHAWHSGGFVDLGELEARLPHPLTLRGAIRDGTLPDTPQALLLRNLLRTRYLSIRLVLQHPHVFNPLIDLMEAS